MKSQKTIEDNVSVKSFTNPQSEEILTNKLLEDIYVHLTKLGIHCEEDQEMGDLIISPSKFYNFMKVMNFLPQNMPQLNIQLINSNQFLMNEFDKNFEIYEVLL